MNLMIDDRKINEKFQEREGLTLEGMDRYHLPGIPLGLLLDRKTHLLVQTVVDHSYIPYPPPASVPPVYIVMIAPTAF
jgi:hypothetical protein